MDGLVRFLKDQPFGAVNSIILINQGALISMPLFRTVEGILIQNPLDFNCTIF